MTYNISPRDIADVIRTGDHFTPKAAAIAADVILSLDAYKGRQQSPWGMNDLMVTAAFRYCLGRRTYIVGECADWLVRHWQDFRPDTRALIKNELAEEFERDDRARTAGESIKPLGDDCDRASWERVRLLP